MSLLMKSAAHVAGYERSRAATACIFLTGVAVLAQAVVVLVASVYLLDAANRLTEFAESRVDALVRAATDETAAEPPGLAVTLAHGPPHGHRWPDTRTLARKSFEVAVEVVDAVHEFGTEGILQAMRNTTLVLDTVAKLDTETLSSMMNATYHNTAVWSAAARLVEDADVARQLMAAVLGLMQTNRTL